MFRVILIQSDFHAENCENRLITKVASANLIYIGYKQLRKHVMESGDSGFAGIWPLRLLRNRAIVV